MHVHSKEVMDFYQLNHKDVVCNSGTFSKRRAWKNDMPCGISATTMPSGNRCFGFQHKTHTTTTIFHAMANEITSLIGGKP